MLSLGLKTFGVVSGDVGFGLGGFTVACHTLPLLSGLGFGVWGLRGLGCRVLVGCYDNVGQDRGPATKYRFGVWCLCFVLSGMEAFSPEGQSPKP